eukprot:TRINITY_DN1210_c0_g1_i13.p1 TRINITY_DN1210_c0_g1~~TRINITY_DN1210_c0_g1_i13.p1  ORF type:complete len:578 (+),score=67.98 TRINITY_DN1210_c0_g1_i13:698-2431(+)
MRQAIQAGEYDKVVRDYNKALSTMQDSNIGMFKAVLEEVERIVQQLQSRLYDCLRDADAPVIRHEETIRLLIELSAKEDPLWYCLAHMAQHVTSSLAAFDSTNMTASFALVSPHAARQENFAGLCGVLTRYLPPFVHMSRLFSQRTPDPSASYPVVHTYSQVQELLQNMLQLFTECAEKEYQSQSVLQDTPKDTNPIQLLWATKEMVITLHKLCTSVPASIGRDDRLNPLSSLLSRLIGHFLGSVARLFRTEASRLGQAELSPQTLEKENKLAFPSGKVSTLEEEAKQRITRVPMLLLRLVQDTLALFSAMPLGDQVNRQSKEMGLGFVDGIQAFGDALHKRMMSDMPVKKEKSEESQARLLWIIRDSFYTRTQVLTSLQASFQRQFQLDDCLSGLPKAAETLQQVERVAIDRYVQYHATILNRSIQLALPRLAWVTPTHSSSPLDAGPSVWVRDVLHNLSLRRAHLVACTYAPYALAALLDGILQTMLTILSSEFTPLNLSLRTRQQCQLDLYFMHAVCGAYFSSSTLLLRDRLLSALGDSKTAVGVVGVSEAVDGALQPVLVRNALLLDCFALET